MIIAVNVLLKNSTGILMVVKILERLGITAASEVSYSFVNDTYVWGLMDNMWTRFYARLWY